MPPSIVGLAIARSTTTAYPELLPELARRIEDRGFRALLSLLEQENDADAGLHQLDELPLAAIIMAALPSRATLLARRPDQPPLLLYNCHAPLVDSVSCNHAACGGQLATMLLAGGHRRFGLIGGPARSPVAIERLQGARDVLAGSRALAVEVEEGDYTYDSGQRALDALFARMKPRPSAVIAMNDLMALGALDRARALQVRIPRDLSVVGIDGIEMARLPVYRLATMRQPLRRMAAAAADMLVRRQQRRGDVTESRLFAGELVRGATARFEPPVRRRPAVPAS